MANSYTRFRAYQLKDEGISCSYSVDDNFTLIGARYNEVNKLNILQEMNIANCKKITRLHIASWDEKCCKAEELEVILKDLQPTIVETPGDVPLQTNGLQGQKLINIYTQNSHNYSERLKITPQYVNSLNADSTGNYNDMVFNPVELSISCVNDNSTIKLFRKGRFTVLNLGTCQSKNILERLMRSKIVTNKIDVLLIASNVIDNESNIDNFIATIKPNIGIFCNDNDSTGKVLDRIFKRHKIPFFTTKAGDVLITCQDDNRACYYNLGCANNYDAINWFEPKHIL